jgi:hypothetical protein
MLESNAEKALQAKLIDITLDATKCNPGQSCSSRKFSVHTPFSGYEPLMKFNAAEEFKSTCFMSVTFETHALAIFHLYSIFLLTCIGKMSLNIKAASKHAFWFTLPGGNINVSLGTSR